MQFNTGEKTISTNSAATLRDQQKMNAVLHLIPYTKLKSKQIMDLNIEYKAIKLLEKNIRENIWEVGLRVLYLTPKPQFLNS